MERILITCLLILSFSVHAISTNKTTLRKINSLIANIQVEITQDQQLRINLQKQLAHAELKTSSIQNNVKKVDKIQKHQVEDINFIHTKIEKYKNIIEKQKKIISKSIRTAYLLRKLPLLKFLPEDQDSLTIKRLRIYYYFLAKNQAKTIRHLLYNLALMKNYELKANKKSKILRAMKNKQLQQQQNLKKLAEGRKNIINKINARIQNKNQRLQQLFYNKVALEKTIKRLRLTSKKNLNKSEFIKQKGKLSWPTRGKISNLFGTKIYHSELTWNGIVITAPEGEKVRAIADGKIVFADWLSGYGLLLIIDHGKGFMSLYGRNENISKKVGYYVNKGEVVATVGNSGGYLKPGLYFAIRKDAKPLNPAIWCR